MRAFAGLLAGAGVWAGAAWGLDLRVEDETQGVIAEETGSPVAVTTEAEGWRVYEFGPERVFRAAVKRCGSAEEARREFGNRVARVSLSRGSLPTAQGWEESAVFSNGWAARRGVVVVWFYARRGLTEREAAETADLLWRATGGF